MARLERLRFAKEPRANRVPTPFRAAAEQADGDGMSQGAMRATKHLAAKTPWPERLASFVKALPLGSAKA